MIFRANSVKIVKEGIYEVADEDKYHIHVPSQALWRPSTLRVKRETDTQRNRFNAPVFD